MNHSRTQSYRDKSTRSRPLRICHVITGLDTGGAEIMLRNLLSVVDHEKFTPIVISIRPPGPLLPSIRALGVQVYTMNVDDVRAAAVAVPRLIALLRQLEPDVVQSWMPHANLLAGLAARAAGAVPVVWGIHQTNVDLGSNKWSTVATIRLCGLLSRYLPKRVVYCAEAAAAAHVPAGFDQTRRVVIPNGFDVNSFRPDAAARVAVRSELGIDAGESLVGLVARWDPLKDHDNFIAAAAGVAAQRPDVRFVLAGSGITAGNGRLMGLLDAAQLSARTVLLGARTDVSRILAALDVSVLSSTHEAMPMVVGEAMACAVPCAVTDVGDAALLVGDTGRIVPPGDPGALAQAILFLLSLETAERSALGAAARKRIVARFSLEAAASAYHDLHAQVAAERAPDLARHQYQ